MLAIVERRRTVLKGVHYGSSKQAWTDVYDFDRRDHMARLGGAILRRTE